MSIFFFILQIRLIEKKQSLRSFLKHNKVWKQELKITWVAQIELIAWKHWRNIKPTKSLYKFKIFVEKWSDPPC